MYNWIQPAEIHEPISQKVSKKINSQTEKSIKLGTMNMSNQYNQMEIT